MIDGLLGMGPSACPAKACFLHALI